ncbi:MAG: hypothetical protein A3G81_22615 [Betaproteobacteria bacterium RIFCSPLOWO2_12_FULL_65_14]|nr:MAG: hypothetical protein A3G81_22615 [Betaproteobacteria bacterium RIFCSPLOWO2_12_FULL_65_14]
MPRVIFHPDSRSIEVPRGERLLAAAWKAGVGLKSVCGGRGKCGSCLVEIDGAASAAEALTRISDDERALLPPEGEAQGFRLACLCEVHADVTLSVPAESQAVRSSPRKPYTVTQVALRPVVKRVCAEVAPARAEPLRPLAERLRQGIAGAVGRKSIELPVAALADFSAAPGFDSAREVTATLYHERRVLELRPGRTQALCGVAIDIGTTSIVVFLCDLLRGQILAVRTAGNPQAIYGEDVISRMTHIQKDAGALAEMRRLLIGELNRLIDEAASEAGASPADIVDAVAVGNPTMQHILLGVSPEPLGRAPYLPVLAEAAEVEAAQLGLRMLPRGRVFVFPSIAGYIGGDTLAALLTRGSEFYRGTHLLVDIGTNGEVVLAHNGELLATSCATGPVYEGAHIRCGVRAAPGAIERVWVEDSGRVRWAAIRESACKPDPRPVGLCGSGVISSVAAFVGSGLVGEDGSLAEEIVIVPAPYTRTGRDIVLTQQDIRSVQLGKSALRAGIEILLAERGIVDIDRIYFAGTFGNHLEPEDILNIGLVPPTPVERIRSIGNAAGDGARMALFNRNHRRRVAMLARRVRVVELSTRADFQDLFVTHTALAPSPQAFETA